MEKKEEFFEVNVKKYSGTYDFFVKKPSSLKKPKNNSVMFLMEKYADEWEGFLKVERCLIFWPASIEIPKKLKEKHAVISCEQPRLEFCRFFKENNIKNLPQREPGEWKEGYWISDGAGIQNDTIVLPGAYIGGEVTIGNDCYIGSGVRLVGNITIGHNVVIRENTVIGADGLSTDRTANGNAVTMPQFGGVRIGNNVEIGANSVIGRGAIDDTIIEDGCKIDNSTFISHNVYLGKDTFVVGETILFGSSSTGERAYISGNATIRNKIHIGSDTIIGMGAVVTKNVQDGTVVLGNPAVVRK